MATDAFHPSNDFVIDHRCLNRLDKFQDEYPKNNIGMMTQIM